VATPSVSLEAVQSVWPQVVEEVRRRNIALAVTLQEGVPSKVEGSTLTVTFRKDNGFHMQTVERRRGSVEEALAEQLGQRLRLRCVRDEQGVLQETQRPQRASPRQQLEEMAQNNPALRTLMERLDTELLE
jgi:hypothetical protein